MFCPHKNSYLQLPTSVDPKLVNKAVRRAMRKTQFDPHDELPAAQRMMSMQPSLYGPWVDITRTPMGYERLGLRIIAKDINSDDSFIKLQAIHTLMDQVKISENAMFLLNLNVVYHLINLLEDRDPIVKEKVCLILTHLANYHQGRKRIISQPIVIDRLMVLFMQERKEIRYAGALCLKVLCSHGCGGCETIIKNENLIENLLKAVKDDHAGIILLHLDSLKNLTDWDPSRALKANAIQVMLELTLSEDDRVVQGAMDCLKNLCKHSIGQKLADNHDLTRHLIPYLNAIDVHVIISTLGVMMYTSTTNMSKWRIREYAHELVRRLVRLCLRYDVPVLQLRAMQILINICDSPDVKKYIKRFRRMISRIKIRTPDQWDGTTTTKNFGFDYGHDYRTRYIKNKETIKVDLGDNENSLNVREYLERVSSTKERLIRKINSLPHKD